MPRVEERVVIASAADLQYHFDSILPQLYLVESEDSWQKIEKSLIKLEVITKSGGYKYDSFPSLFKGVAPPIINSLLSERTKLSGTAADLINSVAPRLGERFEPLVNVFIPTLLLISARTNKVALVRAKKCLLLIAKHCKLVSLLPHLREGSKDKSQTARSVSVETTLMLLESIENRERVMGKRITDVENIIKGTATDRDPEVRQWCKKLFELYIEQWPDRASSFTSTFTPTTRRYLALSKTASNSNTSSNKAAPTPTQRFSPPPVRRPQQQPKQYVVKQAAYGSAKPRSHLGVLSTNGQATSPAAHSPMPMKQNHTATTVTAKAKVRQQQQQQQQSSTQSHDENNAAPKNRREVVQQEQPEFTREEEEKRASLRAELLKQATGTPSQSVAARLALEKFEFQLKKSQGIPSTREENAVPSKVHRDTDRLLFNVAMSKKQSPKKGPGRIIVNAPPMQSTSRAMTMEAATKPAQRIVSSSSGSKLRAKESPSSFAAAAQDVADAEAEEETEPDVFRSRPIPASKARVLQPIGGSGSALSSPKVASSTSRGLGGRERLLGPSMRNANRAKMVASSSRKNLFDGKKNNSSSLKIDLGKENIPPGSMLSSLAQQTSEPSSPEEEEKKEEKFTPVLTRSILQPEKVDALEGEKDEGAQQEQVKELEETTQAVVEATQHTLPTAVEAEEETRNVDALDADDTMSMAVKIPIPSSSPSRPATWVQEEEQEKDNSNAGGALDDWTQVVQSLPLSSSSSQKHQQPGPSMSSPNKKKTDENQSLHFSPPSMSTPLRKPLGAIQGNTTNDDSSAPSALSPTAAAPVSKGPALKDITPAAADKVVKEVSTTIRHDDDFDKKNNKLSKTPLKTSSSPTKKTHNTPSAHIRKVFSLLASRKM